MQFSPLNDCTRVTRNADNITAAVAGGKTVSARPNLLDCYAAAAAATAPSPVPSPPASPCKPAGNGRWTHNPYECCLAPASPAPSQSGTPLQGLSADSSFEEPAAESAPRVATLPCVPAARGWSDVYGTIDAARAAVRLALPESRRTSHADFLADAAEIAANRDARAAARHARQQQQQQHAQQPSSRRAPAGPVQRQVVTVAGRVDRSSGRPVIAGITTA